MLPEIGLLPLPEPDPDPEPPEGIVPLLGVLGEPAFSLNGGVLPSTTPAAFFLYASSVLAALVLFFLLFEGQ